MSKTSPGLGLAGSAILPGGVAVMLVCSRCKGDERCQEVGESKRYISRYVGEAALALRVIF